jgi:hypothetical protein
MIIPAAFTKLPNNTNLIPLSNYMRKRLVQLRQEIRQKNGKLPLGRILSDRDVKFWSCFLLKHKNKPSMLQDGRLRSLLSFKQL